MIVLDNDGVLTDGKLIVSAEGIEAKAYDIRDGFGVIMARRAGIEFGIITGLLTPIVEYRARQLGIVEVRKGFTDKVAQLEAMLDGKGISLAEVAYMGDDIFDIPVMRRVGLGAAPSNGHPLAQEAADWVSSRPGGDGCVRELIELILRASGKLETLLAEFTGSEPGK